jgi:hypothetical protein
MKQLGDTAFTTSHNAFESSLSSSTGSAKGERREQSTSHSTSLPRQYVSNVHLQLLIAPLTFVSFLVSLALIDTRNTSLRGNHPKRPEPTSLLGPVGASLHHLVYKPVPDPSPYAYISSPDAKSGGRAATKGQVEEPWHWHTKQRQQMKAEIADAFRVRQWVLFALLGCALSSLVGTWVIGRWMVSFLKGWM